MFSSEKDNEVIVMIRRLKGEKAGISMGMRKLAAVFSAMLMVSLCSGYTFAEAHTITIADAKKAPVQIETSDTVVGRILSKQGIVLNQGDQLNYALTDQVGDEDVIRIYRANKVKLTYMGETKEYHTIETKVSDMLAELGIVVDENDTVLPTLSAPIREGLEITVVLRDQHKVTVQEEISYQTKEVENANMAPGERKVVQQGTSGVIEYEYDIAYEDGKELSRTLIRETILANPVDEIVEYGPEQVWQLGVVPAYRPTKYSRVERFKATAYDASPADNGIWAGMTSTGMPLVYGVIAVDPKVIPYGTKMYIESVDGQYVYGYAIAGDCGGAIKGKKVDLFFPNRSTCYQFGRRDVNIYFLD